MQLMGIDALILCGGQGSRLQEVVSDIPKPMAPIAGKPFLEYLILQLKSWAINDIVLSVGYKKESIISYFSNGAKWNVNITYLQEEIPLGTGGAIREALKMIDDRDIIAMNGDSFFDADFSELINYHRSKNALATLSLVKMDDTGRYGRVVMDEHGEIISFTEKQSRREGLINAGLYILNRRILSYLPDGTLSFESDVLPQLVRKELYGLTQQGFFIDIGIPDDYRSLCNNPEMLRAGQIHE